MARSSLILLALPSPMRISLRISVALANSQSGSNAAPRTLRFFLASTSTPSFLADSAFRNVTMRVPDVPR